jgi:FHS family L-fucose permease-like MFS transporter
MSKTSGVKALPVLISVFFFWGFVAASNTILIGLFKKNFELTQFQSQLVDLAFYTAYAVGSFIYFFISYAFGDPLNKIGYKKGLIIGLIISAIGAFGFIPAAGMQSFWVMLISLFVIALGFALQQIVANPYVIAMGNPETGAHRVSLAGGINSFGTTIGPLLLALAIYGNLGASEEIYIRVNDSVYMQLNAKVERTTNKTEEYLAPFIYNSEQQEKKGVIFIKINSWDDVTKENLVQSYKLMNDDKSKKYGMLLVSEKDEHTASAVKYLKATFPESRIPLLSLKNRDLKNVQDFISQNQPGEISVKFLGVDKILFPSIILGFSFLLFAGLLMISKLPSITNNEKSEKNLGALKYPQVILGMIAIFIYVGVEVTIQSNLPELMKNKDILGKEPHETAHFISLYWGCLMIGRWMGAIGIFKLSKMMFTLLNIIVPFIAFGVIIAANGISGSPLNDLYYFAPFILLLIAGFFISQGKPAKTMLVFGSMAAIMMLVGMFATGKFALYSFISGGLFCSVMWPCIFSLSIAGLGKYTAQASSLLIMMILGGALIPPFQGIISDATGNIHLSYFIPVICFVYLAFYGWKVKQILEKQGINYDTQTSTAH